jgi:hypothetical protein
MDPSRLRLAEVFQAEVNAAESNPLSSSASLSDAVKSKIPALYSALTSCRPRSTEVSLWKTEMITRRVLPSSLIEPMRPRNSANGPALIRTYWPTLQVLLPVPCDSIAVPIAAMETGVGAICGF